MIFSSKLTLLLYCCVNITLFFHPPTILIYRLYLLPILMIFPQKLCFRQSILILFDGNSLPFYQAYSSGDLDTPLFTFCLWSISKFSLYSKEFQNLTSSYLLHCCPYDLTYNLDYCNIFPIDHEPWLNCLGSNYHHLK